MREILFRGKSVNDGRWVFGDLSNYGDCKIIATVKDFSIIDSCEIIPETVGQYTGLKDAKGTRIFEFDICKAYIHISKVGKKELTGAICFEEGAFKFKCKRYIFNIYDLSASIEVIGNVFDNSLEELQNGN